MKGIIRTGRHYLYPLTYRYMYFYLEWYLSIYTTCLFRNFPSFHNIFYFYQVTPLKSHAMIAIQISMGDIGIHLANMLPLIILSKVQMQIPMNWILIPLINLHVRLAKIFQNTALMRFDMVSSIGICFEFSCFLICALLIYCYYIFLLMLMQDLVKVFFHYRSQSSPYAKENNSRKRRKTSTSNGT